MTFPASSGTFVQTQTAAAATAVSFTSQAVGTNWTVATGSTSVAAMAASPMADWCVIQYAFNAVDIGLWVTTDGGVTAGATIGGTACIYIPPMAEAVGGSSGWAVISNIQASYNWNIIGGTATYYDGNEQATKFTAAGSSFGAPANDQSYSYGRTAQSANTGTHLWNTAPNWLSFIPDSAATGHVTVTFQ